MATPQEWSVAYARQAFADLQTYDILAARDRPDVPECHSLLFLQMTCEKLVKAYLCGQGIDAGVLQASHAYIAKNLLLVLRNQPEFHSLTAAKAQSLAARTKHLAQEIEVLAPAVRRGGDRPDNCEYPWEDPGGQLHIPLDWRFSPSSLIVDQGGRTILKLIRVAIQRLVP